MLEIDPSKGGRKKMLFSRALLDVFDVKRPTYKSDIRLGKYMYDGIGFDHGIIQPWEVFIMWQFINYSKN